MKSIEDSLVTLIQNLENNGAEFEDNNLAFEIILEFTKKAVNAKLEEAKKIIPLFLTNNNGKIESNQKRDSDVTKEWNNYLNSLKR